MVSSETKKYILSYVKKSPLHKCTISEICNDSGLTRDTVVKYMEVLVAEHRVTERKVANARAYEYNHSWKTWTKIRCRKVR
jgi:predicted transcriptional regulator